MYPIEVGKKKDEQTQHKGTELLITLRVDAAKLYKIEHTSREDINAYCHLSDTNPPESHKEEHIEHFESLVEPGQQVRWIAKPGDPKSEFTVSVESVVHAHYKKNKLDKAREENFFNAIAICSSDGEIVRAKVNEGFESGTWVYIYDLNFNIRKEGKKLRSYSIDPRLKIEL
ncbi:hypothetical protein [Lentiprolixibacter aurantiacus]|uniref:Uncharacterized protein n=1 Tax=Lentiprolixibacter aurantiacus TaxID=2993939 RepID=A0AAE3MLN1_9FLAO|nr:hypothetical protein [Lentiprolixibacter aurantiacus]MCX2719719.1 hypothetical protein [Lentiprolixibacter aurantiacus]